MIKRTDRKINRSKRHKRVRLHVAGTPERPRLAVFRSINHVYAQLIDDGAARTLAAASTVGLKAKGNGMAGKSYSEVVGSPEIHALIQGQIDELNSKINKWESIKKFAILDHDLSIESGEMTPSMKVKRNVVETNNKELLDSFYAYRVFDRRVACHSRRATLRRVCPCSVLPGAVRLCGLQHLPGRSAGGGAGAGAGEGRCGPVARGGPPTGSLRASMPTLTGLRSCPRQRRRRRS